MLAFPMLAVAFALIAVGTLGGRLSFEERRRDRLARKASLYAGVLLVLVWLGMWFL